MKADAEDPPMRLRSRSVLLLACTGLGAGLAAAGQWWSGSAWWWLALPGALALGWLFVADPTRCEPRR